MNTLMQTVLKDTSLSQYHSAVIEAIVTIFKTLGLKCVPFLGQIVPSFVTVIRSAAANRLELYFNQLAILVSIVRQHIRPYTGQLIDLVIEFWSRSPQIQATVLSLIEALSRSLEGEFQAYGHVARFVPLMLEVLESDMSARKQPSERILHTILVLCPNCEFYMHIIIPVLVNMFQKPTNPLPLRRAAIDTIGKITRQVNIIDYTSVLIHSLREVLYGKDQILKQAALDCICALIFQSGDKYLPFDSSVKKALTANHIPHHNYDLLVSKLYQKQPLPQDLSPDEQYGGLGAESSYANIDQKQLPVNQ